MSWAISTVDSSETCLAPYCIIVFLSASGVTSLFLKNSYVALVSYHLPFCLGILAPGCLLMLLIILTKRSPLRMSPKSRSGKSFTVILCITNVYVKELKYFYPGKIWVTHSFSRGSSTPTNN